MIMLGVVPAKESIKVSCGVLTVQKSCWVLGRSFDRSECRFHKRVVIGGSRSGKQLGHLMEFKHILNRLCLHLTAPIVDNFRSLIFRQIQNVLGKQAALKKLLGLLCCLIPTDKPVDDFAGIFIQQQVQIEEKTFFISQKVADIPAPSLVGTAQLFSNRRKGSAIVMPLD